MAILKTDDELEEEARTASREPAKAEKPKGKVLLTDEELAEQERMKRRWASVGVTDKTNARIDLPNLDEDKTKDFKFNWLAAYEGSTGKTLHNTPEDVKTLDNWILGQMGKIENESLPKVAYDLKIYNPEVESWSDFLSSPNGQEFKKMLADTRSYKQQKDVEQIWDDGSGVVNFMLPVTKEYAKRNYQNIRDLSEGGLKDIAVPLAFDVASQAAMTGLPSAGIKAGLVKSGIENAAAPVISEAGQVALNDKDLLTAAKDAGFGIATNLGTPAALGGIGTQAANIGRKSGLSLSAMKEQARINAAANKAASIEKRLRAGEPYFASKPNELTKVLEWDPPVVDFYGGDNPLRVLSKTEQKRKGKVTKSAQNEGKLVQPEAFYKNRSAITPEEMQFYNENQQFIHGRKPNTSTKIGKEIHTASKEHPFAKVSLNKLEEARNVMKKSLKEHGDLRLLTPDQLAMLNLASQETLLNKVGRGISNVMSDNPALANYLTNMAGKPQFGQRATRGIASIVPIEFEDKEDEKKSKVFTRDYLLGGRK